MSYPALLVGASALDWQKVGNFIVAQREWMPYWMAWWTICVMAYLTNPTPATFRNHLTSLSFHTHLRRISTSSSSNPLRPISPRRPSRSSASRSSGHVLSFSNRISLSILTPPYTLRSHYLFSSVLMSSTAKKSYTVVVAGKEQRTFVERGVDGVWIGIFGGWYQWKVSDDGRGEEEDRLDRLQIGVAAMEAEESVDDDDPDHGHDKSSSNSLELEAITVAAPVRPSRPARFVRRGYKAGSAPPLTFAQLRTKSAAANSAIIASPSPTSSHPSTKIIPAAAPTKSNVKEHAAEDDFCSIRRSIKLPGLPFHISRPSALSPSSLVDRFTSYQPPPISPSSTTVSLHHLEPPDPVVDELKIQVEELHLATEQMEHRLQQELEVLRDRKLSEDGVRAELKLRTKVLEEQKRIAEVARVEAERLVGDQNAAVRRIGERVGRLQDEMDQIDRRATELAERKDKKKRDKKERERKMREDVLRKREDLKASEEGVMRLEEGVAELTLVVEGQREMVALKKNDLARKGIQLYSTPFPSPPHARFYPHAPSHAQSRLDRSASASDPASPLLYSSAADDGTALALNLTTYYPLPLNHPSYPPGLIQQLPSIFHDTHSSAPPTPTQALATFLPFDFDYYDGSPGPIEPTSLDSLHRQPILPPTLQRDSHTLFAGTSSADAEIVRQEDFADPLTPHQSSLIPSQLFDMLEEEEEESVDGMSLAEDGLVGDDDDDDEEDDWLGSRLATSDDRTVPSVIPPQEQTSIVADTLVSSAAAPSAATTTHGPTDWSSKDELLLSPSSYHKLPHLGSLDLLLSFSTTIDNDDLPRHGQGLSLNPDAKSFQFQALRPSLAASPLHSPTTPPPPPAPAPPSSLPTLSAASTGGLTSSSTDSGDLRQRTIVNSTAFGFYDDAVAAKSRMDFAVPSSAFGSTAYIAISTSSSAFDWSPTAAKGMRNVDDGNDGVQKGSHVRAASFNPFDDFVGDSLLGKGLAS